MPSILYCTITVKRAGARAQRAAAITRRQGIVQILRASENRELSSGELAEDACRAEPLLRKHSKLLPRRPPIRPPPPPRWSPSRAGPGPSTRGFRHKTANHSESPHPVPARARALAGPARPSRRPGRGAPPAHWTAPFAGGPRRRRGAELGRGRAGPRVPRRRASAQGSAGCPGGAGPARLRQGRRCESAAPVPATPGRARAAPCRLATGPGADVRGQTPPRNSASAAARGSAWLRAAPAPRRLGVRLQARQGGAIRPRTGAHAERPVP